MSIESYKNRIEKNPERAKSRWQEWKDKNPEKAKTRYKEWYERNKEKAKKMKAERMREYRGKDPEKFKYQRMIRNKKIKDLLFGMYGKSCSCCGFTDIRALTLDHIKNNGADERKRLGEQGVYRRAVEMYRPEEYRILCMNCQFIKRIEYNNENQHNSKSSWRLY